MKSWIIDGKIQSERELSFMVIKRLISFALAVVLTVTVLLGVSVMASITYPVEEDFLFTSDFETNSFWSSGRTLSDTAFSGSYVIKGNSNSGYVYSSSVPLEKNVTYIFSFWYRNPTSQTGDKVAVFYKRSSRYMSIKSITLEQTTEWKYCSFEFKHSNYADFYFGVQGADVEIDSVSIPFTYKTCGNLIENGSFEEGDSGWKVLSGDATEFSGDSSDGMSALKLATGINGVYTDFETLSNVDYTLTLKYKGNSKDAGFGISRVNTPVTEEWLLSEKVTLSPTEEWKTVSINFNSYVRNKHRFVIWADSSSDILIDSVSVKLSEDKNLISNGGFESGTENWSYSTSPTVSNLANSGDKALKQSTTIYSKIWQGVDVEPDTDYIISFCYKGSSWLKWAVSDATGDSNSSYSPEVDGKKGYITGQSKASEASVNWQNVTTYFNSGVYNRIAFAVQSSSATADLIFDDIVLIPASAEKKENGYFDSYGKKTPYNTAPYITDSANNLFKDYSFENPDGADWNNAEFINASGSVISDGTAYTGDNCYKFSSGENESESSLSFKVTPDTYYWLTLKIKTPKYGLENSCKLTFGIADIDTGEFLLGKNPDEENYRAFTSNAQLTPVAADDEWHMICAKFYIADETEVLFKIKGTNAVSYFDDIYLFKDENKISYKSNIDKLADMTVVNSNPEKLYPKPSTNLFENSGFSDGETFWNSEADKNALYGTKLNIKESHSLNCGKCLSYENTAKYPNRIYYIKWVAVEPNTDYTLALNYRINTVGGGNLTLLSGYAPEGEAIPNQVLPTRIKKIDFSEENYNSGNWQETAVTFNTKDKNFVGFAVYDGGGAADVDNIRLFRTADAVEKQTAAKPENAPESKIISFDRIILNEVAGVLYGIKTENGSFNWSEDNEFTGLSPDIEYSFAVKYPETDSYYESDISDISVFKTYKKGDINTDSNVDVRDLVALKKNIVNLNKKDYISDLGGDGEIKSDDIVILRKILLNLFSSI